MKSSSGGGDFIRFDDLDPDVERTVRAGRQRQEARRGSPAPAGKSKSLEQRQAEKAAKQAAKDAKRNRRMIDWPVDLQRTVEGLADELGVTDSSLIVWLLDWAVNRVSENELLDGRAPSRSMRYEYVMRINAQQKRRRFVFR